MSTPAPFSQVLRAECQKDWQAAIQHRFVDEIFAGTLSSEHLRHYLVQDYQFVDRFVALLCPNGCGKSTLLKHLYRVHAVQEGRVTTRPRSVTSPQMSRWNALLQYRSRRSARARTPHAVPCKRYVDNTGSIQLRTC